MIYPVIIVVTLADALLGFNYLFGAARLHSYIALNILLQIKEFPELYTALQFCTLKHQPLS